MEFAVKLPLFEGAFDLLLFFIQRDEIDIYDIPISQITQDFLAYLKDLEKLNIEIASDFILVAATLMRIKSKMLLPRPEIDSEGNEIDPRQELVSHLLEYKKYKDVSILLAELEAQRAAKEHRGNVESELASYIQQSDQEAEMQSLTLYKMLQAYISVMQRFENEQNKPVHQVVPFPYTIEQQKDIILEQLQKTQQLSFLEIIQENLEKIAVIFKFLAILELLQLNKIALNGGDQTNDFSLSLN